jgi:hypothetical protein
MTLQRTVDDDALVNYVIANTSIETKLVFAPATMALTTKLLRVGHHSSSS